MTITNPKTKTTAQKIYRVIPLQYERSSCGGNSLSRSVWTEHFSLYFWLLPSFSSAYRWNFLSCLNYPNQIPCLNIGKKKGEKKLKPSNTWLVSAFVCFRVWERSRGDIDERKISEFPSPWNKETILINYLAYWITRLKANETIYAWFAKKRERKLEEQWSVTGDIDERSGW